MSVQLNRRHFALGASALLASTALIAPARAQATTRSVTTVLGTYDIPLEPQRVVVIDARMDLEPAIALGLPVIAANPFDDRPWVPVPEGVKTLASPTNIEEVLMLEPDLIVCAAAEPDSEWWPANKLMSIAPVLPTDYNNPWRKDLENLADWLDRRGTMDKTIAEYDDLVASIKERHADAIATKKVAAVHLYAPDKLIFVRVLGTNMGGVMQGQVIDEIGGITVSAADIGEDGGVSLENLGAVLGDVDALLISNIGNGGLADFLDVETWQRLPAVAEGRTYEVTGNTNFGSLYTALHVAHAWDEVYKLLA